MQATALHRATIIGAGQMGRGIAQVCLHAGMQVALCDRDSALSEAGAASVQAQLAKLADKGKLSEAQCRAQQGQLLAASFEDGAAEADVIIEAVSERLEIKQAIFEQLAPQIRPQTVLLSNTSSISISKLAASAPRPEAFAGMHFMNPVPLMRLVEVVQGLQTSATTVKLVVEFAERLGKTVVVSQDRPGFIVNRILIPMLNEACFALQEGVSSVEQIDSAIELGLNHPMGPLRLSDLIGLDTVLSIAEVLHQDFADSKYRPASLLRNLVAAGYLGRKSGRGFYTYEHGKPSGVTEIAGVRH